MKPRWRRDCISSAGCSTPCSRRGTRRKAWRPLPRSVNRRSATNEDLLSLLTGGPLGGICPPLSAKSPRTTYAQYRLRQEARPYHGQAHRHQYGAQNPGPRLHPQGGRGDLVRRRCGRQGCPEGRGTRDYAGRLQGRAAQECRRPEGVAPVQAGRKTAKVTKPLESFQDSSKKQVRTKIRAFFIYQCADCLGKALFCSATRTIGAVSD